MRKSKVKANFSVAKVIILVILLLYVLTMFAIYGWALFTSLKPSRQFLFLDSLNDAIGLPKGLPWEWEWNNYIKVLTELKVGGPNGRDIYMGEMLFNTLLYSVGGAFVNNFTMWLVAYLITRFKKYKLSRILYVLNIAFMSMPIVGSLPSALYVFNLFGWYNNYWFILFNNIAFTGMYLLIYCAFIDGLGRSFYESAEIDGAGHFTIMMKIAFPLTSSMFIVVLINFIIARWNDYMTMVAWMPDYPTLAYGVFSANKPGGLLKDKPLQIAASMVLMVPMLVMFLTFQKQILGNLRLGAIK